MPKIKFQPMFDQTGVTPEASKQRMAMARALMDQEATPIHSTAGGLLHAGSKALGGWLAGEAMRDEQSAQAAAFKPLQDIVSQGLGGGSAPLAATPAASGPATAYTNTRGPSAPPIASGDEVRSRNEAGRSGAALQQATDFYVKRGYSPTAAAAIAGHLHHESAGFDPGVVTGKRLGDNGTAFGIAQWRGPRLRNLQRWAEANGKDFRSLDTQLEFVDVEMRSGMDRGAGLALKGLQAARSPEEAVAAFMHFERPAGYTPDNPAGGMAYAQRLAQAQQALQALGGAGGAAPGGGPQTQFASGSAPGATTGGGTGQIPPLDLSEEQQAVRAAQQMMQNPRTQAQGWQLYQQAVQSANQKRQLYLKMQMEQQGRQEDATLKREGWDRDDFRQEQRIVHERDLHNDKIGLDRDRFAFDQKKFDAEQGKPVIVGGTSRLVDPQTGKEILPANPQQQQGIEIGPDGSIKVNPQLMKPPTETQAKWGLFHQRGKAANSNLSKFENALTSLDETLATKYGGSLGNYYASDKFQMAKQAADDFLVTIIRPDTGAAVTPSEFEIYGNIFLPKPGDKPGVIEKKRQARTRAVEALKQGMTPQQVLQQAVPEEFDGETTVPNYIVSGGKAVWYRDEDKPAPGGAQAAPGARPHFPSAPVRQRQPDDPGETPPPEWGGDAQMWEYMTPDQRKAALKEAKPAPVEEQVINGKRYFKRNGKWFEE